MDLNKIDREFARCERELARHEKAMASVDRAGVDLRALDKAGAFDAGVRGAHAATDAIRGAEHGALRGVLDAGSGTASIPKTTSDLARDSKLSGIAAACSKIDTGITKLDATPWTDTIGKSAIQSAAGLVTEQERKWIAPVEIPALGAFDRQMTELNRTLADLGGMQRIQADLQTALKPTWHIPALSGIASFNSRIDSVVGSIARNGAMSVWQSYEDTVGKMFQSFDHYGTQLDAVLNSTFTPYLQDLGRLAMGFEQWMRTLPSVPRWGELGFKALEALEAFDANKHWIANAFLRSCLRLPVNEYTQEALWLVLKRGFERPIDSPVPWLTLDYSRAVAYLRVAVRNEAKRIKRDREMGDRLYWRGQKDRPLYTEMDPWGAPEEDPGVIVARRMDYRAQILDELVLDGTEGDKEIIRLVREGEHDRAGIRNLVGSSRLQSFERKLQRMGEDEKFIL